MPLEMYVIVATLAVLFVVILLIARLKPGLLGMKVRERGEEGDADESARATRKSEATPVPIPRPKIWTPKGTITSRAMACEILGLEEDASPETVIT